MRCKKTPASMRTNLSQGVQRGFPTGGIQFVGGLRHPLALTADTFRIWEQMRCARNIVPAID